MASDGTACIVSAWLRTLHLGQYADAFLDNGYDDLEMCKQIGEADLDAIGVCAAPHREALRRAVRRLREQGGTAVYFAASADAAPVHRYPRAQLRGMLRERLVRDGIRLGAHPHTDGQLEGLAARYAAELRTHAKDVVARLEEIRRRRTQPQGENAPSKSTRNFKPGKYSPSSCLSENEEESIYSLYEVPPAYVSMVPPEQTPRCLSPRSRHFYEPCPFPAEDPEPAKKRGALGRLFRSLGSRKGSPRHKCTKPPPPPPPLNVKYLAEGPRLQVGGGEAPPEGDQVRLLVQLFREGYLSVEDAKERPERIRPTTTT